MSQKTIIVDDLTDADIPEGGGWGAVITLRLVSPDPDVEDAEYEGEWDVTADTAESLRFLIEDADLPTFMTRMRPVMRSTTPEAETIRSWMREHHPELDIPARGKLGTWAVSMYRRETAVPAGNKAN